MIYLCIRNKCIQVEIYNHERSTKTLRMLIGYPPST